MDAYELVNIVLAIGNRIDLHWGLFISVHLALLGAIIYIDRPLRFPEKMGAILLYSGFAFINYGLMNNQAKHLTAVYADINIVAQSSAAGDLVIIQTMAADEQSGRSQAMQRALVISHGLMYVLVLMSIVLDTKKITTKIIPPKEPDNE